MLGSPRQLAGADSMSPSTQAVTARTRERLLASRSRVALATTWATALTWFFMGFVAKLLDFMPRHRMIAARLVGEDAARLTTNLIGVAEILLAFWILTRAAPRTCALVQTLALAVMNAYELTHAPDLLLLGWAHIFGTIAFLAMAWTAAELSHRTRALQR